MKWTRAFDWTLVTEKVKTEKNKNKNIKKKNEKRKQMLFNSLHAAAFVSPCFSSTFL